MSDISGKAKRTLPDALREKGIKKGEVRNPKGRNQYSEAPEVCRQMILGYWTEEGIDAGIKEIRAKGRLASTYLHIFAKVLPDAPQEVKANINAYLSGENWIAIGAEEDDAPGGTY